MKRKNLLHTLLLAAALTLTSILALTGCGTGSTDTDLKTEGLTIDGTDFAISIEGDNVNEESVFTSNDIIYYEDRETYDSGNAYGEGSAHERHTAEEAAAHTVVNITQPGTYRISGTMEKGQIRVDLGEDAFENPEAVVTLVLDGADIHCDVAPAILFLNVYECDNQWSADTAGADVDTAAAGANLIIADGTVNNIDGGHVARIYKDTPDEKKLWKQDGAIYSYMSMNVSGETAGDGVLNLNADNEGLDTELHLTINSGNINIFADNDGINTNEDGVSVTAINGGEIHILAGLGAEGDGIDSNGWLVINGGTVISSANPAADAGLDSDMGSYVNGGTVVALGSTMDWAESDSEQVTMNLQFASYRESSDAITIKNSTDGSVVFSFDPKQDKVLADNLRKYQGAVISCSDFALGETYHVFTGDTQQSFTGTDVMRFPGGMNFGGGQRPDGMQILEGMEMPDGMQMPEGFDPSQMPQGGQGFQGGNGIPGVQNRPGGMPEGMKLPEGMELPDGFDPSQMPQGGQGFRGGMTPPDGMQMPDGMTFLGAGTITDTDEPRTEFYMQDKVNAFSGLADVK